MITDTQKKKYIKNAGSFCPHCGSMNLVGDSYDMEDGFITQRIDCYECDKHWYDVYTLTGIEET